MDFLDNSNAFAQADTSNPDDIDGFGFVAQDQPENNGFGDLLGDGQDGTTLQQNTNDGDLLTAGLFDTQTPVTVDTTPQPDGQVDQKKVWQAKKQGELAKIRQQQEAAKQAAQTQGKNDLAKFLKDRDERITKTKAANRAEEENQKKDLAQTLESGSEWEKVAKFCDLKPRADTKQQQQGQSTERMRSLLVDLRNDKK